MSDIRSWALPFAAIGAGFTAGTYLTLATSTATSFAALITTASAQPEILTGRIYSATATNRNAAIRYLQIWAGAVPGSGAPFPTTPVMQFLLPPSTTTTAPPQIYGRDFFGVSGLEFVDGRSSPSGSRAKMPISVVGSSTPTACGFSVAISTTAGSYVAATAADHDLQGTYGA